MRTQKGMHNSQSSSSDLRQRELRFIWTLARGSVWKVGINDVLGADWSFLHMLQKGNQGRGEKEEKVVTGEINWCFFWPSAMLGHQHNIHWFILAQEHINHNILTGLSFYCTQQQYSLQFFKSYLVKTLTKENFTTASKNGKTRGITAQSKWEYFEEE